VSLISVSNTISKIIKNANAPLLMLNLIADPHVRQVGSSFFKFWINLLISLSSKGTPQKKTVRYLPRLPSFNVFEVRLRTVGNVLVLEWLITPSFRCLFFEEKFSFAPFIHNNFLQFIHCPPRSTFNDFHNCFKTSIKSVNFLVAQRNTPKKFRSHEFQSRV